MCRCIERYCVNVSGVAVSCAERYYCIERYYVIVSCIETVFRSISVYRTDCIETVYCFEFPNTSGLTIPDIMSLFSSLTTCSHTHARAVSQSMHSILFFRHLHATKDCYFKDTIYRSSSSS